MSDIKLFESQKIRSHREVARQGGTVAGNTRKEIESKTGKQIVSKQNAKELKPFRTRKRLD